jgi:hypothetical protein
MTEQLTPVMDQVLESCRNNWEAVENKEAITVEWWLAFLGRIPDDVHTLADNELLALSLIGLQEELNNGRQ